MTPQVWLSIGIFIIFMTVVSVQSSESNYTGPKFQLASPLSQCYRSVPRCVPLNSTTQCLDVSLPYRHTYPPVSREPGQNLEQSIHRFLAQWRGLRAIPQCWNALQSALCASFFPRCEIENSNSDSWSSAESSSVGSALLSRLSLPTDEMCRNVRSRCRLVDRHFQWPEFLHCDNQSLFSVSKQCTNQYTDFKFNQSKQEDRCVLNSLVSTDDKNLWYPDIDGCALRCNPNPLYHEDQHQQVSQVINRGSLIGFSLTAFVMCTFLIDFKSRRYPAIMVFYINLCLFISYFGWRIQHFVSKAEVTCRADNSARYGTQNGHIYCFISFTILYYFSLAALLWFILFSYACMISYRTTGATRSSRNDELMAQSSYFHVIAWTISFCLTLVIWFLGQIDGDSVYGVCFVGLANREYLKIFALLPLSVGVAMILCMFGKTLMQLWDIKKTTLRDENIERRSKKCCKINRMIYRIALVMLCIFLGFIGSIYLYYHQSNLTEHYEKKLNNYIICNLNISDILESKRNHSSVNLDEDGLLNEFDDDFKANRCAWFRPKPDLVPIYWQLVLIFGTSLLGFIWICTRNTWITWKRCFQKYGSLEYYQKLWKSARKKRLTVPIDEVEEGDNNNGHSKRRKIGSPAETHTGITTETNTFRHLDPVEMDFTSIGSHSLINSIKDRFNKILTRGGNRRRSSMGSAQTSIACSTTNAGQSFSDMSIATSVSQMHGPHSIEMTSLVGVKHRENLQRRRRSRKIIRSLKRRGSESSISTAFITIPKSYLSNGKLETKSTSTGDLVPVYLPVESALKMANSISPMLPQAQQPNSATYQIPSNMMTPFMTPPGIQFTQQRPTLVPQQFPFGHNMSFMNGTGVAARPPGLFQQMQQQPQVRLPQVNPFPRPRLPSEMKQNSYAFTHGMDDQSGKLVKPFEEKRRPGSSLTTSNPVPNTQNNELSQNFTLNTLSSNQAAMGSESAAVMSGLQNSFLNYQIMPAQYSLMSIGTYNLNGFARPPLGALNPMMYGPVNLGYNTILADQYHLEMQKQNLTNQEMEQLLKERETLAHLITATRSESSIDNGKGFLAKNIVISDSEYSGFSDSSRISQYPEFVVINANRIEVEERMKMVEDEQKSKGDETGEEVNRGKGKKDKKKKRR